MTRPSLILPPGTRLGGYEIEDVLGIGGMAIVYRAVQHSLGRPVALKVLNPRLAADATFRQRFRREGAMVAALDHPNVVPVHDLGEVDGRLFLAMRLIDGVTLADRIEEQGVSADETREVLRPLANALDAAHAAGVLHRDVKPQNVLLADDGSVYLADFGVAKAASSELTRTREFFGSVSYVAPEQIRGEPIGRAADIYALAVLAHQCLTGTVPFHKDTDAGVIHAHLEAPPPPIGAINDPAAVALSRAVGAGLEKDPEDRPSTAGAFVDAVELALVPLSHAARSVRPAFPAAGAATALPLPATGGEHPARGGTQPIAVQSVPAPSVAMPPAAPVPVVAPTPAAPVAPAPAVPAPPAAPVAVRRRRRWPLVLAVGVLLLLLFAVPAALLLPQGGTQAEASVDRLAASGAPERVTRAARDAREAALARARAAERKAAAERAAARRRAAKRKAEQAAAAASSSGTASSGSGSSSSAAPSTSSGAAAPAPSSGGSSSSSSSGSSGGSTRAPSAATCDFPPC